MANEVRPVEQLEKRIGYVFRNREIIGAALTHSSYSNEKKSKGITVKFNERLEFLGDSVLSIVVSSYLFDEFTGNQEGDLTKLRASLVCEKSLSRYAESIELGEYLYLGHGEEISGGRHKPSITADAFEALLAAMYLDSGESFDVVERFLMPFIKEEIKGISKSGIPTDYKTALQQIIQQAEGELLEYVLVSSEGPDHDKKFLVEARLNSNVIGTGTARTKREAEQRAAREALVLFGELPE